MDKEQKEVVGIKLSQEAYSKVVKELGGFNDTVLTAVSNAINKHGEPMFAEQLPKMEKS